MHGAGRRFFKALLIIIPLFVGSTCHYHNRFIISTGSTSYQTVTDKYGAYARIFHDTDLMLQ